MLKLFIAFTLGTAFGVAIICCCIAAGKEDRELEQPNTDNTDSE